MKSLKAIILIIPLIALSLQLQAGKSCAEKRGDKLFEQAKYAKAVTYYEKVLEKYPSNMEAMDKAAQAYEIMGNYGKAAQWYGTLANDLNGKPIHKFRYAQVLQQQGNYQGAVKYYQMYAQQTPGEGPAEEMAEGLEEMLQLSVENPIYTISLSPYSTKDDEMGPVFYRNGQLAFATNAETGPVSKNIDNHTGLAYLDMVVANHESGELSKDEFSNVNGKYNEGPASFSADFTSMYLTRNNYKGLSAATAKDGELKLQMFQAVWDADKQQWTDLKESIFNSAEYNTMHPSLSADGNRLYFASDMPGGYGGSDIYVSYWHHQGKWGPPINLGSKVNTEGDELFPFYATDGTLYYASDSKVGLGGLDVYMAQYRNASWSVIQNLGAPINSTADDFGYIVNTDGSQGYFVSNRNGGAGGDDMYSFTKQGKSVSGVVVDLNTGEAIPSAQVRLLYQGGSLVSTTKSGANGQFMFAVEPNVDYILEASLDGYQTQRGIFNSKGDESTINVELPLIKVGGKLSVEVHIVKSEQPVALASVTLANKETGEKQQCVTEGDGVCYFYPQPNAQYELTASAPEGTPFKKSFTTQNEGVQKVVLDLNKGMSMKAGSIVELDNILYETNSAELNAEAKAELDMVAEMLLNNPNMSIELRSHTDCIGDEAGNTKLSSDRAVEAVMYIWNKAEGQIDIRRIEAKGMGEYFPKVDCACDDCSEEQHQANRRTEIKVLTY